MRSFSKIPIVSKPAAAMVADFAGRSPPIGTAVREVVLVGPVSRTITRDRRADPPDRRNAPSSRLSVRHAQSALIFSSAPSGQEAESGDSWYFFWAKFWNALTFGV